MSETSPRAQMIGRRAELLAELFLQELNPSFVARPESDLGYDFFVGLPNARGGVNIVAVQVKATEQPVGSGLPMPKDVYERLASSNVPVLVLAIDVKRNRLSYAIPSRGAPSGSRSIRLPLTEASPAAQEELRALLGAVPE